MTICKYIIIKGALGIESVFLFNQVEDHKKIAMKLTDGDLTQVLSAGFCTRRDKGLTVPTGEYEWHCYGESTSLNMKSKPEDSDVLNRTLINMKPTKIKQELHTVPIKVRPKLVLVAPTQGVFIVDKIPTHEPVMPGIYYYMKYTQRNNLDRNEGNISEEIMYKFLRDAVDSDLKYAGGHTNINLLADYISAADKDRLYTCNINPVVAPPGMGTAVWGHNTAATAYLTTIPELIIVHSVLIFIKRVLQDLSSCQHEGVFRGELRQLLQDMTNDLLYKRICIAATFSISSTNIYVHVQTHPGHPHIEIVVGIDGKVISTHLLDELVYFYGE